MSRRAGSVLPPVLTCCRTACGKTVPASAVNGAGMAACDQVRADVVWASESHQAWRIAAAPQALGSITPQYHRRRLAGRGSLFAGLRLSLTVTVINRVAAPVPAEMRERTQHGQQRPLPGQRRRGEGHV